MVGYYLDFNRGIRNECSTVHRFMSSFRRVLRGSRLLIKCWPGILDSICWWQDFLIERDGRTKSYVNKPRIYWFLIFGGSRMNFNPVKKTNSSYFISSNHRSFEIIKWRHRRYYSASLGICYWQFVEGLFFVLLCLVTSVSEHRNGLTSFYYRAPVSIEHNMLCSYFRDDPHGQSLIDKSLLI